MQLFTKINKGKNSYSWKKVIKRLCVLKGSINTDYIMNLLINGKFIIILIQKNLIFLLAK